MKKSTIWLLAVIMALTFIGLLYVQIMYMENMIKMRNEQFTEAVKRSLYAVSTSLELDETQRYLDEYLEEEEKKMLSSYEQKQDKQDIASTHHQFLSYLPMERLQVFLSRTNQYDYHPCCSTTKGTQYAH